MSDEGFHEIQLNSKQLIFLCMTAALVLVVAFLSGVLVGRGVRSEKEASAAADAVTAAASTPSDLSAAPPVSNTPALAPPSVPPTPVEDDLTYDKRLEGKQPPKETLEALSAAPAETKAAAKDAPKAATEAGQPSALPKDVAPAKDTPAGKASPADAAKPTADTAGFQEPAGAGYYLKVVAYKDRGQAEGVARRLNGKGYRTWIVAASGNLFSVRVGKYKTRKEADSIRRRLEKEEQLKPLISH